MQLYCLFIKAKSAHTIFYLFTKSNPFALCHKGEQTCSTVIDLIKLRRKVSYDELFGHCQVHCVSAMSHIDCVLYWRLESSTFQSFAYIKAGL